MAERHLRLGFGLAVLLFVADQALKTVMIGPLALQAVQQIYLLCSTLRFDLPWRGVRDPVLLTFR